MPFLRTIESLEAHDDRRGLAGDFWWKVALTVWLALDAIIFRGYSFGFGDQAEQLPAVLRVLDPVYLTRDWFVNSMQGFGPRTCYAYLVAAVSRLLGVELAFGLIHFACWGLFAWGIVRLTHRLLPATEKPAVRFFAGVLAAWMLAIWSKRVTGANPWLSGSLIPSEVAHTLGIWALLCWLDARRYVCAILVLVAGIIHPLIGPLFGLTLAVASWWGERESRDANEAHSRSQLVSWLALGAAILLPLLVGYWSDRGSIPLTAEQKRNAIYILAFERHPWHYVPWTWSRDTWIVWALLLGFGLYARYQVRPIRWLDAFACVSLGFTALGWVSLWWAPLWPLVKLQPFRMTIWLELASFIYLAIFLGRRLASNHLATGFSAALWIWMLLFATQDVFATGRLVEIIVLCALAEFALNRTRFAFWVQCGIWLLFLWMVRRKDTHQLLWLYAVPCSVLLASAWALKGKWRRNVFLSTAVTALGLLVLIAFTPLARIGGEGRKLFAGFNVGRFPAGPYTEVANWAKANTAPNALFLLPPQDGNFRLAAHRAIVVNFKTFAWGDEGLLQWRQRMDDVTGNHSLPLGNDYYPEIRDGYNSLTPRQIAALQRKYHFDYVMVSAQKPLSWPLVFSTGDWKVYKAL